MEYLDGKSEKEGTGAHQPEPSKQPSSKRRDSKRSQQRKYEVKRIIDFLRRERKSFHDSNEIIASRKQVGFEVASPNPLIQKNTSIPHYSLTDDAEPK